jgi:uncharacterized FAD-dependent dehydrogenase
VKHGAPERILVDSKPHMGTDRLVRILKDMRQWLIEQGAEFRFSTKVENICISSQVDNGKRFVNGVLLSTGEKVDADFVVLAVGHSARQLYRRLQESEVALVAKPIAVGFRIEHPQELINKIQVSLVTNYVYIVVVYIHKQTSVFNLILFLFILFLFYPLIGSWGSCER